MITTLTGENDAARSTELTRIVTTFLGDHDEMGLERLDGEDATYEQMLGAVTSLPFLVDRKLVVLRSPGVQKEFAEKLEAFISNIAETNDVVIVEPKLDKRTAYYKSLKKLTDFRDFAVLDANGLAQSLQVYAKEQGGELSSQLARRLIDRVGQNQLLLQHELDKLLSFNPSITEDAIEELTEKAPQSSIFDLLEAAFAGEMKRTRELYAEQRALKVEPQQITAMLAWQLHVLALVKAAGNRGADEVAREAKLNPFVVRKSQNLARTLRMQRLKELIHELRVLDTRSKTEGIIPDEAIEYYLFSISADA